MGISEMFLRLRKGQIERKREVETQRCVRSVGVSSEHLGLWMVRSRSHIPTENTAVFTKRANVHGAHHRTGVHLC